MNSNASLTQLKKTLQKKDTLLLIGSGISIWSGLPTWARLIKNLADYLSSLGRDNTSVLKELEKGDLLLAASYGIFQITPREFDIFITDIFNEKNFKPADIHKAIINLGPTSFATSNYDTLLEDAILASPGNRTRPRVVTNKNFIAMPQIIQSSSRDFIFKYHGDISDTESIVLTREQYKNLKGQYEIVTQSLSTLFATRPVVMLGFGLRDPDFLSIKDDLAVSFLGQAGEHFAIMSDFSSMEIEYWRRHYNIEVISYSTKTDLNGNVDHSELLTLLESLSVTEPEKIAVKTIRKDDWNSLLSRLAGRYLRLKNNLEEFPLNCEVKKNNQITWKGPSSSLLEAHENLAIIGGAGSGKSHLLSIFAASMSQRLLESCWVEKDIERKIPILVDLRQYSGNLFDLLQAQLPNTLDLKELIQKEQCYFLLDGANEMPEEVIESGIFIEEISKLTRESKNCRIAITGRNGSWKEKIEFPTAELLAIEKNWLSTYFEKPQTTNPVLREEFLQILNTPLMLSLVTSKRLDLSSATSPTDIHRSVFSEFNKSWNKQNSSKINIEDLLAPVAFLMLDQGVELTPYETVKKHLRDDLNLPNEIIEKLLEHLITEKILNALPNYNIAFFHQTATEYLAALELVKRQKHHASILLEKFAHRRWDQALFFSISLLPEKESQSFFNVLCNIDMISALRAAKYIEHNQAKFISSLLVLLRSVDGNKGGVSIATTISTMARLITELPFSVCHEKELLKLMARKDELGGAAAKALIHLKPSLRSILLTQLLEPNLPYSYISSISAAFAKDLQPGDLYLLLTIANINESNIEKLDRSMYECRKSLDSSELFDIISNHPEFNSTKIKHIISILCSHQDTDWATDYIQNCVIEKNYNCTHLLNTNIQIRSKNQNYIFNASDTLLSSLIECLDTTEHKFSIMELIKTISTLDGDSTQNIKNLSSNVSPAKAALIYLATTSNDQDIIEKIVENLNDMKNWQTEEIASFTSYLPWKKLSVEIVRSVITSNNETAIKKLFQNISQIKHSASLLATPEWWLESFFKLNIDDDKSTFVELFNLSTKLVKDPALCAFFLNKFNSSMGSEFRILARYIINIIPNISTNDLSPTALHQLTSTEFGIRTRMGDSVLGLIASESFVKDILIPLLNSPNADLSQKIETAHALEAAGKKHNKRYLLSEEHRQLLSFANSKYAPHRIKGDWYLSTGA